MTGLDPQAVQEFYGFIRRLNREEKVAIVMVSHDVANMVGQADKILHLQQKVLFYGTAGEYKKTRAGREFLGGGEA